MIYKRIAKDFFLRFTDYADYQEKHLPSAYVNVFSTNPSNHHAELRQVEIFIQDYISIFPHSKIIFLHFPAIL